MAFLVAAAFLSAPVSGLLPRTAPEESGADVLPVPAGYVHRPVIEFFTGLSCPSCMGGPHPDMEKLWSENGYRPEQPLTYVVFHELNGGGVDDLQTPESEERMRYYQPGISGTPDSEFDGGYIELGGMTGGTLDYNTAQQAVADSTTRHETTLNPLHPIQSLRNGFKFVKLEVRQVFTGDGFAVTARATYLGTSAFVETKSLNGQLFVFMVEDNVTAYSKVEDQDVLNHNVFRGYAVKGEAFTLRSGESKLFAGQWDIPADAKVPVKPGDVSAVAVVYDADDTSSEEGNQGNPNRVPRAVQSATPLSTAYDEGNDLPRASSVKAASSGGKVKLSVTFDDENGIASAFVLYNSEAQNATNWSVAQFNLSGTECEGDTCSVYENATGTAVLEASGGGALYAVILMYDGNLTQGRAELMNLTAGAGPAGAGGAKLSPALIGGGLAAVAAVGLFYLWKRKPGLFRLPRKAGGSSQG